MRIHSVSTIRHPQQVVYEAYRDRLSEIAAYMSDIRDISVESRESPADGVLKLHNVWTADREVPAFARAFIKPEMMKWDDHAEWKDAEHRVYWTLKLRMLTDQVRCSGTNTFAAAGDGETKVTLEGDLDIDVKNVPGVPRILAGGIKPQLEKFIVSLITPNLEAVNQSLQAYLDDQS